VLNDPLRLPAQGTWHAVCGPMERPPPQRNAGQGAGRIDPMGPASRTSTVGHYKQQRLQKRQRPGMFRGIRSRRGRPAGARRRRPPDRPRKGPSNQIRERKRKKTGGGFLRTHKRSGRQPVQARKGEGGRGSRTTIDGKQRDIRSELSGDATRRSLVIGAS